MCNWTETWSCTIIYLVLVYKQKKRQNIKGQFIFSFLSISPKFFGSWMWGLYKILPRNFKPQHKQLRVDVGVASVSFMTSQLRAYFQNSAAKTNDRPFTFQAVSADRLDRRNTAWKEANPGPLQAEWKRRKVPNDSAPVHYISRSKPVGFHHNLQRRAMTEAGDFRVTSEWLKCDTMLMMSLSLH